MEAPKLPAMSLSATLTIVASMIAMMRPSITVMVINATGALARARNGLDTRAKTAAWHTLVA